MFRKSMMALAAVLVLGSATAASAEDSSSSFTNRLNAMTARAWGGGGGFYSRSVGLHRHPYHHRHYRF